MQAARRPTLYTERRSSAIQLRNSISRAHRVNALQSVHGCLGMVAQIFRYSLLVDQPTVDTRPNNIPVRAHYPLAKLGVLARILRAIAKHAHLSFEMTRIVRTRLALRQAVRLHQTLAFLALFRKLFFLRMLHFP
jgi:hypothetical protein